VESDAAGALGADADTVAGEIQAGAAGGAATQHGLADFSRPVTPAVAEDQTAAERLAKSVVTTLAAGFQIGLPLPASDPPARTVRRSTVGDWIIDDG